MHCQGLQELPTIIQDTELRSQGNVYAHGYAILKFNKEYCDASYYQNDFGKTAHTYSEML